MSEINIALADGSYSTVNKSIFEELQKNLRGEIFFSEDDLYHQIRKINNGMINRKPAFIIRCLGIADVINSVKFAREHNLLASVRSGGHGVAGFAVCEGGLMIDLSSMNSIHVDPSTQTARTEGGTTWGMFDHETQAFGLATTGGVVRTTGIGGLTLAGGHGYLMRKHGLACDNLISADVVTADGQLCVASEHENEDLFWGLRGGGGNFGIVTSFNFRLHPINLILGGLLIYPIEQAKKILEFYNEFTKTAPDELGSIAVLGTLPDGTKALIFLLAYCGPIENGEKILKPLRTIETPIDDQIKPLPYLVLQSIVENFNPPGLRNYWKATFLKEISDDVLDNMIEHYASVEAPYTHVVLYTLGGAMSRIGAEETAVSFRDARHIFIIIGMWDDLKDDNNNIHWVRQFWNTINSISSGGNYVNYDADTGLDRVKAAYGPQKYERLVSLKNKYDPDNFFCLNQNIKPES